MDERFSIDLSYLNKDGVNNELNDDIENRIVKHKNQYYKITMARMIELLPTIRKWYEAPDSLNVLKTEFMMKTGYNPVLSLTKFNKISLVGWVNTQFSYSNPTSIFATQRYKKNDINFLPGFEKIVPDEMEEISYLDECKSGNFVVLRNKSFNLSSDYEIIQHYVTELTEIHTSIFSLILQAKVVTVFKGDPNNESINQAISKLFNNSPILKISPEWDFEDSMKTLQNIDIAENVNTLRDLYLEKMSDLFTYLGVKTQAVNKDSGVSPEEINANDDGNNVNQNIYLEGVNTELNKLNKRFNLNMSVGYNTAKIKEMGDILNNVRDNNISLQNLQR